MRYANRHTGRTIYQRQEGAERIENLRQARNKVSGWKVYAGSPCLVRRGGGTWRDHATKEDAVFERYSWRNELLYGFARDGWEMKVSVRYVYEQR